MTDRPSPFLRPEGPVLVRIAFSRLMLQNLLVAFQATTDDRNLVLEVGPRGVWAVTEDGARMCIGYAKPPVPRDA